jgi:branched-subunit amino acid aminotransferase/4-amino-4-deoxychorismate lyase
MPKMKKEGAIDVLYYDRNEVRETSRANVFMVKDNQVFTPVEKILKGITRKRVLGLSSPWPVTTKSISKEELMAADEVFITSTTKSIMPITHIDNIMIGNGEVGLITTQLSQLM